VLAEIELGEIRWTAMRLQVDGAGTWSEMKESRWSATSVGDSIGRRNSHTALRSRLCPPGSASLSLRTIRSVPSAFVRVTPSQSRTNAAAQRATSCAMP
jgi:hypothetical protein